MPYLMTEAVVKIVVLHTDGHSLWLAPWLAWVWIISITLYLLFVVAGLVLDR